MVVIKIITNYNKQDVIYTYRIGQSFPDIQGKLLRIEISGNELARLLLEKEIPICAVDTSCLIWHDHAAGSILKLLRKIWL